MRSFGPGAWLAAGATLMLLVAVLGWSYVPKDTRLLFGEPAPIVPISINVGSFIALCVGGVLAYLSYAASTRAEVAQRFQKAVELVSEGSETSAIGGFCILHEVATEHHRRYLHPYAMVVESHIYNHGYEHVRKVLESSSLEGFDWPRTHRSVIKALQWLTRVPRRLRWWGTIEHVVFGLYLNEIVIAQCDFSKISIHYSIARRVRFNNCTFADCKLKINVIDKVEFSNCNFVNCDVELFPERQGQDPFDVVGFDGCRLTNATINLERKPDGDLTFGRDFPLNPPAFKMPHAATNGGS